MFFSAGYLSAAKQRMFKCGVLTIFYVQLISERFGIWFCFLVGVLCFV